MLSPDYDQKLAKHSARCSEGGDQHTWDEYGICFECDARKDNVVSINKNKPPRIAVAISKVYARGEVKKNGDCHWAFHVTVGENKIGYAFGNRTDAIKGRVLFQKKLKKNGLTILSKA